MDKDKKLIVLKNLIEAAEISLQQARKLMVDLVGTEEEKMLASEAKKSGQVSTSEEGQVIEGVFDGQNMVGPDGKKYSVPANYASKSKLVEGDSLKLTITADGSFVYKQINLLDRDRIVGELIIDDETNEYRVLANNKSYKVLTASITYFKGESGDKITILVPRGQETTWAAVENIFKGGETPLGQAVEEKKVPMPAEGEIGKEEESASIFTGVSADKPADREHEREETKEEVSDEFLSHEEEEKAEKPPYTEASGGDFKDIFEAAKETDTDDVKQVEPGPSEDESLTDELQPGSTEQVAADLINQPARDANASLTGGDSQGLDEI